jgi:imidazolonepropionase-like amidohydrolase
MSTTNVYKTDEELLPLMTKHATKLLDAGVTTARDLGSQGLTAITIRDRISRHEIPGPRIQCANAPLTVPGGHACSMGGECIGVEACRKMVRQHKNEGADLIKVMATGGFMTPGTHVWEARYSQEELNAMADEARECGMPITTHAIGTEGIERAVEAQFNCIEHCSFLSMDRKAKFEPEVAEKMVQNNVSVCPTVSLLATPPSHSSASLITCS